MDCKAIMNIAEYSRGGKLEGIIKLTTMIWDVQKNIFPVGLWTKIVDNYTLTLVVPIKLAISLLIA